MYIIYFAPTSLKSLKFDWAQELRQNIWSYTPNVCDIKWRYQHFNLYIKHESKSEILLKIPNQNCIASRLHNIHFMTKLHRKCSDEDAYILWANNAHIFYILQKSKMYKWNRKIGRGRERIIVGEVMLIRTKIGSPWSP